MTHWARAIGVKMVFVIVLGVAGASPPAIGQSQSEEDASQVGGTRQQPASATEQDTTSNGKTEAEAEDEKGDNRDAKTVTEAPARLPTYASLVQTIAPTATALFVNGKKQSPSALTVKQNQAVRVETQLHPYAEARGRYVLIRRGENELGEPTNVNVQRRTEEMAREQESFPPKATPRDIPDIRRSTSFVLTGLQANRQYQYAIGYIAEEALQGVTEDSIVTTMVAKGDTLTYDAFAVTVYRLVHVSSSIGPMFAPRMDDPEFRLNTVEGSDTQRILRDAGSSGAFDLVFGGIFHPWGQNPYHVEWRDVFVYTGIPISADVFDTYFLGVGWGAHGFHGVVGVRIDKQDRLIDGIPQNEVFTPPPDVTDVGELTRSEWTMGIFFGTQIQLGVFRALFPDVPIN